MKGISSLLIATLVVSAYGGSLEKLEWESIEKLRQENALKKEEVLSFLREIRKETQITNDKFKQILIDFKNREVENYEKNIETWGPGIPPNIISLIKKYNQNLPKKDEACNQNKNQKKDEERSRHRRNASRKDKDSSDEDDDSNSIDDNSSDEESRRSNSEKGKSKQMNSDEKSGDSDEKNSTDSQKDKREKKNSDESNSDDKSNDSDSNENKSRDSRKDKSKKKNSDESNSDDKSNESDSDEKNSWDSRNDKSKQKNTDESNSDEKCNDNDNKKSETDEDDDSTNSAEVKKWKWVLNRGDHQAHNGFPAPWNWELEATRAELKNRLMSLVQLERVIKLLKNRTEELNKRGQWERTSVLTKAMAVQKKLLEENILAVSRICKIGDVEQHQIPELIINCMINYSPGWRKLSNVVRQIVENNKRILNNNTPLQEFLGAHPNLNQSHIILQLLGANGHKDRDSIKEGEQQVNGAIPWQSQAHIGAPPSDNTGAIEQETSLNSINSSDKNKNDSVANDDESAALDKDQAPEPIPTNRKEESAGNNSTDQPDSDSQVPIKNESSSLEPEVSNTSGDIPKAGELDSTSKNEIDKGHNNENSDSEVGENSTGSNNQISTTADSASDDTSSQTDSTTSQSKPSSNIDENTEDPRSTSALSTEETTHTVQNANSESESIINTTASRSTSLIDE